MALQLTRQPKIGRKRGSCVPWGGDGAVLRLRIAQQQVQKIAAGTADGNGIARGGGESDSRRESGNGGGDIGGSGRGGADGSTYEDVLMDVISHVKRIQRRGNARWVYMYIYFKLTISTRSS